MSSTNAKEVALAYHHAFYANDRASVRKLLADRGSFIGPLSAFEDPDKFLDAASIFMKLTANTEIKSVVSEGNDVCILYDSTLKVKSIPTLPLATWFKIEEGKIKFFHVHFDPTSIVAAMASGDLNKALQ
jgi:hypothetical protein